ncbi:transcriptional adapter 3 [Diorhabda sublineata]|uniref:transcriptional adapter 3 n=1 Tax=Diorhabda sublineata TaxID=1163346 RepID=UPI0024E14E09|nr:transcriptional adapter 3 [Diorhabda sublineata]
MNGSKRVAHTTPKNNVRYSGKLKDILQSSTSRHKSEGKVVEPDLLNIPVIKQSENAKLLPKYTSILAKTGEDSVSMDDLDLLQQDLEKLLSTSAVRIRYLLAEIGEIDKNDESHERKAHVKTSLKRKRIDEKPKFKDFKVTLPKNNSDKFWASIEPFCVSVTKDDVAFLDCIIKEFSREIDIKIPEIGEHYANGWSEDIMNDEQNLGKSHNKKTATTNEIKKSGLNTLVETFSIPQTQRLLAGLLEEKVLTNHPKNGENGIKIHKLRSSDFSKLKSSTGGQKIGTCLDRRLKKELVEQGILTIEDLTMNAPEDEILSEIKKCQQELTTVNEYNLEELNKLRSLVLNDLHSNEVKEQLEEVDKEVLDLYNQIVVTRKTAQQEEGDDFDKTIFSEQIKKEFETQTDALLKQQIELNKNINGLTDMQLIY